jgi:hypothetical protein
VVQVVVALVVYDDAHASLHSIDHVRVIADVNHVEAVVKLHQALLMVSLRINFAANFSLM